MNYYYIEKEKYYWLKLILDGILLTISFLFVYYIKRGQLIIEPNFRKFFPLLILFWFFTSIFSKKFMLTQKHEFLHYLKPYIYSAIIFAGFLTLMLYVLGWYFLSRFIVYGTIGLFLILEILILSIKFFIYKKNKKTKNIYFSAIFFIAELIFIGLAFFSIYHYKRGTIELKENYQILLMGIFFAWLFISLLIHKFKIVKKDNYIKTISPFLKSEIILILGISFFIFFFKLAFYSRSIILGSLGLFCVLEISIVSLYYIFNKQIVPDENTTKLSQTKLIEEEQTNILGNQHKEKVKSYDFPEYNLRSISTKEKLKYVYLKKYEYVYKFIEKNLNLDKIDIMEAEVFNTINPNNIKIVDDNSLAFLLNLHKVNDFRRINQYFIEVNSKLKSGGVFISKFESINQIKLRIFQKYPFYFAKLFYFFDFIYKRIWPKLPLLKKIYFIISRGKNRILSQAECLGRLYFCGFELIDFRNIDNYFYFIVKKIKEPSKDKSPSYGLLFKQKRVGKHGKIIYAYKFRTMYPFSEYIHRYVFEGKNLDKRGKIYKDFRITSWGRILRKYYLDELPMIINLIRGDIKLIGVRPLSKTFFEIYPEDLKMLRVKHKPGLIPPYYADLPGSIEEVWESEMKYLKRCEKHPWKTNILYFFKIFNNLLFHHVKSQ